MTKKIAEIRAIQAEGDRRTKIERKAEELTSQCKFEEAMKLLAMLE